MVVTIQKNLMNEQAYEHLKNMIITNQLKPNEKINVSQLALEFNTSKAPVSLAITKLQQDGFIVVLPQSGTFVRRHSYSELEIIYKSRACLEKVIVETYGDKLDKGELKNVREAFASYKTMGNYDEEVHQQLFELDMQFHRLIVGMCDEIIRREISNITDLTKRSRLLFLKSVKSYEDRVRVLRHNTTCHIEIIDALLANDIPGAAEMVHHDIMFTWENVKELID